MKKTALFLSVILIGSFQGFSQFQKMDNDEYEFYDSETGSIFKDAKANESVSITKLNKKGIVKNVSTYKFDEKKRRIYSGIVNGAGKEKSKRLVSYDGKHLMSKEIYKNGKLKYKTKNTFDGDYNTVYEKYNGKEDLLYKRVTTYTDKEYKIITHKNSKVPFLIRKKTKGTVTYKKGGIKQLNRWEYEYDGDGERTKSTLFDKNNEVKHVWDFSCKTEGELVKVKNETQQCKWEEIENGMLVKVTRTTSPKGKVGKTVQKYDVDTNIVESIEYINDVLVWKHTYDKSFFKPLTFESYHKGKLSYKKEFMYNQSGREIGYKTYWGKDKTIAKNESKYTYENNRLVFVKTFKKGEPIASTKITYN